jgi:hypothetical protein
MFETVEQAFRDRDQGAGDTALLIGDVWNLSRKGA